MIFGKRIERQQQLIRGMRTVAQHRDRGCLLLVLQTVRQLIIRSKIREPAHQRLFHGRELPAVIAQQLRKCIIRRFRTLKSDQVQNLIRIQQQKGILRGRQCACTVPRAPCEIRAQLVILEIIVHRRRTAALHHIRKIIGIILHVFALLIKQAFHGAFAVEIVVTGERAHLADLLRHRIKQCRRIREDRLLAVDLPGIRRSAGLFLRGRRLLRRRRRFLRGRFFCSRGRLLRSRFLCGRLLCSRLFRLRKLLVLIGLLRSAEQPFQHTEHTHFAEHLPSA